MLLLMPGLQRGGVGGVGVGFGQVADDRLFAGAGSDRGAVQPLGGEKAQRPAQIIIFVKARGVHFRCRFVGGERRHDIAGADGLQDDAGVALGQVIAMALDLAVEDAAFGDAWVITVASETATRSAIEAS
jgi:hypothetical protein